jgi:outer membrane protein OmpA-like peptidoglycan-associated protein
MFNPNPRGLTSTDQSNSNPGKNTHLWVICLFCFFVFAPLYKAYSLDLNLDQDAYGLGMGGAVAAIAGGTQAIQWNPAGIARASVPMIQLGLGILPATTDFHLNTGFLYPSQDGTVFALSQYSEFPDSHGSNTAYIGSIGLPLNASRDLLLGFNLKFLALTTSAGSIQDSGRGLGLDLGMSYDLRNAQGTLASFALVVKDLDTEIRFNDTNEQPLTRTFTLGAAYQNIKDTRLEVDYQIVDQILQNSNLSNRLRIGAERFFDDETYSARVGFDGLFGSDGYFSVGGGYHPAQPYEISYALRISTSNGQLDNFLNLIYRFDNWTEASKPVEKVESSPEINISETEQMGETMTEVGKPVSSIPLRKMTIQVEPQAFSPSGRQKTTVISFPNDTNEEIARWVIQIQDNQGKDVRRIGGTGPLLPYVAWDGMNDNGKMLEEGQYKIVLKTFNRKKELLSDDHVQVEIVSTRSHFEIDVNNPYFSFNKTGKRKSEMVFTVHPGGSSEVKTWDFEISESSTNKVIFEAQGENKLPSTLKWNGKDLDKKIAADGTYLCLLIAEDKAGNPIKTDALQVFINNTPPDLSLKGEDNWIDFNAKHEYKINLDSADRIGFQDWKADFTNEDGDSVKTFSGTGQPPKELSWDGVDSKGQTIALGSFLRATLTATDKAGNSSSTDPYSIQVEAKPAAGGERMNLNLTTVTFAAMSSDLDEAAKKEIKKAAESIKPYLEKSVIIIKGYAANSETGDLVSLSHDRAEEVEKYLMKSLSIPSNGIYAVGYATKNPLPDASAPAVDDKQRCAIISLSTQP